MADGTKLYNIISAPDLTSNGLVKTSGGVGTLSIASSGTDYEVPLTFSTGLTRSTNTITNNLSTGVTGGQTLIGSTSTNSGLTIKSTTGVGTTSADIIFVVGNNGATEALRILNSGYIGLGITTPGAPFEVSAKGDGVTNILPTRTLPSGYWAAVIDQTGNISNGNGLLVSNRYATSASTILDVGFFDPNSAAYTSYLKVRGDGNVIFTTLSLSNGLSVGSNNGGNPIVLGVNASSQTSFMMGNGWGDSSNAGITMGSSQADTSPILRLTSGMGFTGGFVPNSAGTTKFIFRSDGNAGFGVTSPTAILHLKAGSATASTAPLKFTSGTVLTSPEPGAHEFTTDDFFVTITTGSARKAFILDDGARLTSGLIPKATTNGRLIDSGLRDLAQNIASTGQTADITSTNFTNAGTAGRYRLSYYIVDSVADLTAGAVSLSVTYTDAGGAKTFTSSTVVLTATTAYTQGVIYIQQSSGTIAYSTAHTGLFGTAAYDLYMTLERLA